MNYKMMKIKLRETAYYAVVVIICNYDDLII